MYDLRAEILSLLSRQSSAIGVVHEPDDDECYQILRIAGEPATDMEILVSLNELQAMVDDGLLVQWDGGYFAWYALAPRKE